MSTQITITLTDEVYQRAERFARLANRDIASVLADTIRLSIPPIREEVLDPWLTDKSFRKIDKTLEYQNFQPS